MSSSISSHAPFQQDQLTQPPNISRAKSPSFPIGISSAPTTLNSTPLTRREKIHAFCSGISQGFSNLVNSVKSFFFWIFGIQLTHERALQKINEGIDEQFSELKQPFPLHIFVTLKLNQLLVKVPYKIIESGADLTNFKERVKNEVCQIIQPLQLVGQTLKILTHSFYNTTGVLNEPLYLYMMPYKSCYFNLDHTIFMKSGGMGGYGHYNYTQVLKHLETHLGKTTTAKEIGRFLLPHSIQNNG